MKNDFEKIRLIVADMDGTLLHDDKTLDTNIKELLPKLKELGIHFTLASGRNIHILQNYMEELQLKLPCITNNGANMYQNNHCIYERDMESKELLYALGILEEYKIAFIAYSADAVYTIDQNCPILQFFLNRLRGKIPIKDGFNLKQHTLDVSIFKIVIIPEHMEDMKQAYERINAHCLHLQCVRSEDEIFTMTNVDASKGNTLLELLKKERLKPEEVLVFGDNFNDISMFEVAGISIAMENAQLPVKKASTYVTSSNNENGVSAFLEKIYIRN